MAITVRFCFGRRSLIVVRQSCKGTQTNETTIRTAPEITALPLINQDPEHIVRSAVRTLRAKCEIRETLASQERIRIEIPRKRGREKGDCPLFTVPYMSKAAIDKHLARFDEGAVSFFTPHESGTIGPEGSFAFPKSYMEELFAATSGDLSKIETHLMLPEGYLKNASVAIIDNPNVKFPSGNERGAYNNYWIPGGYTPKGAPEAILPKSLRVDEVTIKTVEDLFNGL